MTEEFTKIDVGGGGEVTPVSIDVNINPRTGVINLRIEGLTPEQGMRWAENSRDALTKNIAKAINPGVTDAEIEVGQRPLTPEEANAIFGSEPIVDNCDCPRCVARRTSGNVSQALQ